MLGNSSSGLQAWQSGSWHIWIGNLDYRFFVLVVGDFFLTDFERDLVLPVSIHERSVLQAVEEILDASVLGIDIEESDAAERKADMRAS